MNIKQIGKLFASVSFASILLSGCAQNNIGQVERSVKADSKDAEQAIFDSRHPLQPENTDPVQFSDKVWLGNRVDYSTHGKPLPYQVETNGVTVCPATQVDLKKAGKAIEVATGIPISFNADVSTATSQTGTESSSSGSSHVNDDSGVADNFKAYDDPSKIRLCSHHENLDNILDNVANYYGITWRYDGNRIIFYRMVTRNYYIRALPSDQLKWNSSIGDAGTSQSSSSGQSTNSSTATSSATQAVAVTVKVWDDLTKNIKGLVGDGGVVSANKGAGILTVTAPADHMDEVQKYIEKENRILSKQVTIGVKVMSLQLTDSSAMNFDLKLALQKASKYAVSAGTGGSSTAASATSAAAAQIFNWSGSSGMAKGTNAIVEDLESKGRVRIITSASGTTLNGIPLPINVTQTRGYLAQVQTTLASVGTSGTSNGQSTLSPGNVTYGFQMSALPEVEEGGQQVLLQLSMSLSDINGPQDGFNTFSSGDSTIQLPNITSRNFSQQVNIPNGSTLVMAGFEQNNDNVTKNGTGTPDNAALGGSQKGSKTRTILVFMVSVVVDKNQMIHQ